MVDDGPLTWSGVREFGAAADGDVSTGDVPSGSVTYGASIVLARRSWCPVRSGGLDRRWRLVGWVRAGARRIARNQPQKANHERGKHSRRHRAQETAPRGVVAKQTFHNSPLNQERAVAHEWLAVDQDFAAIAQVADQVPVNC